METFGPYELVRRIAVGGMAEIFVARRSGPSGFAKLVALKRVLPELARQEQFRTMFADEARLCASLSHPCLVQVFDYGEVEGTPYLVMEWVDGCDLSALLAAGKPIDPEVAAYMVAEVARALAYVHNATDDQGKSLGIVHRDLSPGNVLVSCEGNVKVGDFGVAKARGRLARTDAGSLKGTLSYLAPEQVSGQRVSHATDIYASGLLLFEMLTGAKYVEGDSEVELLKNAQAPPPRRASELDSQIPEALDTVIERALAVDIDGRFPSAAAMEAELRKLCANEAHSRQLLAETVSRRLGCDCAARRQTDMVCVEPEPRRRSVGMLLAVAVVFLAALGAAVAFWGGFLSLDPAPQDRATTGGDVGARRDAGLLTKALLPAADADQHPMAGGADQDSGFAEAGVFPDGDAGSGDAAISTKVARPDPRSQPAVDDPQPSQSDGGAKAPDATPTSEPGAPQIDVRALVRAADTLRRSRGLRSGDDRSADELRSRALSLAADASRLQDAADTANAYRQRVENVAIDRAFVDRKIRRATARIQASGATGDRAASLDRLSQQALRQAMAGNYDAANQTLNQIFAMLR